MLLFLPLPRHQSTHYQGGRRRGERDSRWVIDVHPLKTNPLETNPDLFFSF